MLSKRHGTTGHDGVSCLHYLRSSDPPLNPMECGIDYVIVNGEVLLDHGEHTGALPGQTLRGPLYRGPR